MTDIIIKLEDLKDKINYESLSFDRSGLDHGSPDQTRAIVIESIFEQAKSHINAAVAQLKILNKELY